ncbi:hypothetical protein IPF37_01920 [bacterium]|nr:MAG: hypothetical protein IPF37_01920 [bacterium]
MIDPLLTVDGHTCIFQKIAYIFLFLHHDPARAELVEVWRDRSGLRFFSAFQTDKKEPVQMLRQAQHERKDTKNCSGQVNVDTF